jgi:hypothetical protein
MLLPGGVRIVIEMDGKHHYAREVPKESRNWEVAADLYSKMVQSATDDHSIHFHQYHLKDHRTAGTRQPQRLQGMGRVRCQGGRREDDDNRRWRLPGHRPRDPASTPCRR